MNSLSGSGIPHLFWRSEHDLYLTCLRCFLCNRPHPALNALPMEGEEGKPSRCQLHLLCSLESTVHNPALAIYSSRLVCSSRARRSKPAMEAPRLDAALHRCKPWTALLLQIRPLPRRELRPFGSDGRAQIQPSTIEHRPAHRHLDLHL